MNIVLRVKHKILNAGQRWIQLLKLLFGVMVIFSLELNITPTSSYLYNTNSMDSNTVFYRKETLLCVWYNNHRRYDPVFWLCHHLRVIVYSNIG